jgi:hypothetical protein
VWQQHALLMHHVARWPATAGAWRRWVPFWLQGDPGGVTRRSGLHNLDEVRHGGGSVHSYAFTGGLMVRERARPAIVLKPSCR